MDEAIVAIDDTHFLRVRIVGDGCSGLNYKMDFYKEVKPMNQVFVNKRKKNVCVLRSFLYRINTELEFIDGLN